MVQINLYGINKKIPSFITKEGIIFKQKNRTPSQRRPYKNNSFYDSEFIICVPRQFVNIVEKKVLTNCSIYDSKKCDSVKIWTC